MGGSIVDEAKKSVKLKQQREKEMKNIKNNSTIKTIVTVVITLASVGALAYVFSLGMSYQKSISQDVDSQVKSIVSEIKPSKQ